MHTTQGDTPSLPHFSKMQSQVGSRFEKSFKSGTKTNGFSPEDNLEENSSFFMLLKKDSEKTDNQHDSKAELIPNLQPMPRSSTSEVNRLKPSKSESYAHRIAGFGFEMGSEQQRKKDLQQAELLLVRTDHVCHLRRLSYLRVKDQKKIKQLFFEKSKRLIKKQLGLVISVHFYQNEKSNKRMKTIREENEENESQTISKILNSSSKLNNHSVSANVLRPCRSQERKGSTYFETDSIVVPKQTPTLLKQPSELISTSVNGQILNEKKMAVPVLSKNKSTYDSAQLLPKQPIKTKSSQLNLKKSVELLFRSKKKPPELMTNSDIKEKPRKPPVKVAK